MIPVRLRVEGFLSYREPVELDFTGFSLACISGPNGAGKSSLLDAITWALFGRARQSNESVIHSHPDVKAAEVTLDFDYEGNRYRVQRTNPRGKTSSVEFSILSTASGEERWKPLTERTLRETDAKIVKTLRMDYDTFINASFFLQGKADQFAVARPGERKQILSNILGLEVWETYREAAAQQRRAQEKEVKALEGRLSEIQSELDEGPAREQKLGELQESLAQLTQQREEQARILETLRRQKTALDEQLNLLAAMQTQVDNTTRSLDRVRTTLEGRRQESQAYQETLAGGDVIEKAHQNWQKARQDLEAMEGLAAEFRQHEALRHEPLGIIQAEEARLAQARQGLEERQADLNQKLAQADGLEAQLASTQEEIEAAKTHLAQRTQLEDDIRQLQADQAQAKAENPRLRAEMQELRSRIDQLQAAEEATCPVCGQPLSKDERENLIRDLTKEGEERRDQFLANKDLLENFETRLRQLGAAFADLRQVDTKLREATRRADQLEHQAAALREQEAAWAEQGAPRLAEIVQALSAESFAEESRSRLREIDAELGALGYDMQAHTQLRQAEQTGREAEAQMRALEQARAALAPIEREIAGLEAQLAEQEGELDGLTKAYDDAAARIAAAQTELPDLSAAEANLHNVQERENRLRLEVGAAQQKVTVLATQAERKAVLLEERDDLTRLIANLKQLERAFGKDGVPALLIEQALPEIEQTTNELLSRLSNGRMSFRFVTQREFKDNKRDDLKETLDMVISDSMGARDYEMFSGGEAFRVNFSIRLALSKVLARRAGARLQTLVIDEGFGSQDTEGRQRLVEAINLVRDDFAKVLVITHLEELKDAFPTRIEVEKTPSGSQVTVI